MFEPAVDEVTEVRKPCLMRSFVKYALSELFDLNKSARRK